MPTDPEWMLLSPLEEKIVRAILAAGQPLLTKQIAKATGESEHGRIRPILANLVERKVLVPTAGHEGYRVNLHERQEQGEKSGNRTPPLPGEDAP